MLIKMLFFTVIFAICSIAASVPVSDFAADISNFASDFYQQSIQSKPGNLIISPHSVASALAFLSQASNGNTFDQLKNVLHLSGDKSTIANQYASYIGSLQKGGNRSALSVANQLFVKQGYKLNPNFQDVAVQKFSSGVESVDFSKAAETAEIINHFVEEKTQNKIKDFIKPDSLDPLSRAVLVNAIHFKAEWEKKFENFDTYEQVFYSNETEKVSVVFLHCDETFNYGVLSDLEATALEMKYKNSDFSFLIVLPDSRTGLSALETKLKDYDLTKLTEQLQIKFVQAAIPKFKVESEVDLKDILKKMGISEIFEEGSADLSGLSENGEPLFVSDAIHKAFIEINEEGTEAAAATGFGIQLLSGTIIPPNTPKFIADHPFVYYILDNQTKSAIFSGRITQLQKTTSE